MASRITRDHHSLSRNLKLNGNFISNDGDSEGISIGDDGIVKASAGDLRQFPSGNTTDYYQIQVTTGGATTIRTVDGALGGSIGHLALFPNGNVGIGVTDPDADLEIFGTTTQLKLSYDASNHAAIGVASDGHLALATTGTDAAITLDSAAGVFIMKKSGTEFSATDSAYAGMILGYTRLQNDSTTSGDAQITINSSSMTVLQTVAGNNLSIQFIAPPSGNVEIQCSFWMQATSDGAIFSLSTGTSYAELDETHTYDADQTIYMDETDHNYNTVSFSVTGLTAGTDTTYYLAGLASGAGVLILHGRNRAGGTHYPPIILKAIALPNTIVSGQ